MADTDSINNVEGIIPDTVTPLFIKSTDIGSPITGYNLGTMINEQFFEQYQDKVIEGIQEVRSLWRLYPTSEAAKTMVCEQGLKYSNRTIKCYIQNPYVTGLIASGIDKGYEEKPMVKVTVKDLYKSVSVDSVHHMLTKVYKLDVDVNDIKIGNCRDDQGNLSDLINYDRYIYIHPDQLKIPLPRNAQCGTFKCRIYHKGQFGPSRKCFRCFREDHVSKNCTNPKACRVCLQFGHIPGSPDCRFYTTNTNTRPYGGAEDPLSNHYEGEFTHNHIKMKTVENGWFHQKALKNGQTALAHMCLDAESAKEAKYLSQGIRCTENWDEQPLSYELMKDINRSKFQQVPIAKEALYECWENDWNIVEAVHTTRDTYWGSGLSKEATLHTTPQMWPGSNTMGKILTELSIEFFGERPEIIRQERDWSESDSDHSDEYGFVEMGVPIGSESVDENHDDTYTMTHNTGIPSWNPNFVGQGRGRGKRGARHGHTNRGRSNSSMQSMSRSPSVKRANVSPLYSEKLKVHKHAMVQSKYANVAIPQSKFANGAFKVK